MTYDDLKFPFLVAVAGIVGWFVISPWLPFGQLTRAERATAYKAELAKIVRSCGWGPECTRRVNDLTARIKADAAAHPRGD